MQHTKHIERSLLSSNLRILKAKYIPIETIFNPLQTNFYIHFFFLLSLGPQFMNREECTMIGFIFVLGIKKNIKKYFIENHQLISKFNDCWNKP